MTCDSIWLNDFEQQDIILDLREVFNKDLPFAVKPGIAVWRLIPTTSSVTEKTIFQVDCSSVKEITSSL